MRLGGCDRIIGVTLFARPSRGTSGRPLILPQCQKNIMNQRFKAWIHDCGGLRILVAGSSIRQRAFSASFPRLPRAFPTSPRAEALSKKGPQSRADKCAAGTDHFGCFPRFDADAA